MTEVNDRIASNWDQLKARGIDIVRAGIRTDHNVVEVGVTGLTPETSDRLESEFGSSIQVVEDRVAHADACSVGDCRPMKGGLRIERGIGDCTSGFVVKRLDTSEIMMLTAGHCFYVYGDFGAAWSHNGVGFGIADRDTWHPGITRDGDVGLVDIYTTQVPATKNQVRTTGSTVKAVGGWDSAQFVGDQTCRVGEQSGLDCGQIRLVNVTRPSEIPSGEIMTVRRTNEVSFDSTGGDSGGSMYFTSGAVIIAQGTHVHSDDDNATNPYGWFTPISWGSSQMVESFGFGYSVCVNSSCS